MEDETSLLFQGPFLLHPLQKHVEGTDDVYSNDSGPPGHHIGEEEALPVGEGKHHLLDPAGLSPDDPGRTKGSKPRTQDMILEGVYWSDNSEPDSVQDRCLLLGLTRDIIDLDLYPNS